VEQWSQRDFAERLVDLTMPLPKGVTSWADPTPKRRFGVYRGNMRGALGEAIAVRYPVVQRLVGEPFFLAMAREFAVNNLPRSPVLIDYAANFSDFIEGFEAAKSLPYLADVARLESAYWQAYHADDVEPISAEEFGKLDTNTLHELRFEMLPSFAVVRSSFPIVAIWRTNTEDDEIAAIDLTLSEDALVVRPRLDVEVRGLPSGAGLFLSLLHQGVALGEAVGVSTDASPGFDLAINLTGLIQARIVKSIHK
jgi:Putative DNA-binding domain